MTKDWFTKIDNFMTPGQGFLCWGVAMRHIVKLLWVIDQIN